MPIDHICVNVGFVRFVVYVHTWKLRIKMEDCLASDLTWNM